MADPHPGPARVDDRRDESSILLSLEFLLRKAGFDAGRPRRGRRSAFTAFRPDVALLDVMLPRRQRARGVRFIRGEPQPGTRILLLTAKGGATTCGVSRRADESTSPAVRRTTARGVKALAAERDPLEPRRTDRLRDRRRRIDPATRLAHAPQPDRAGLSRTRSFQGLPAKFPAASFSISTCRA
jgi:CheY-like chemotaxis protein